MNEPLVSIIIPAKNASRTIGKCLASVVQLDYPAFEIIVVEDHSDDDTLSLIRSFGERVRCIAEPATIGPSAARNQAAQMARGNYLAFTDADCIVDKQWLRQLMSGFTDERVAAVGGAQSVPADETDFGKKVAFFLRHCGIISEYVRSPGSRQRFVRHNASCNVVYRKDIFLSMGGFAQWLWPGEDVEIDHRLIQKGYRLRSNPHAVVYHYRPETMRQFLRMMWRYGWAQGVLVRRYGIFRLVQVIPFAAAVVLPALAAGLLILPAISLLAISAVFVCLWLCLRCSAFQLRLALLAFTSWHSGFVKGLTQCVSCT